MFWAASCNGVRMFRKEQPSLSAGMKKHADAGQLMQDRRR
jgi:hypothetical protein